jgi:hypothetical protein
MKLFSRLFRNAPPPPAPVAVEPPPAVAPAPPVVDPEEQQRVLSSIESGAMEPAELVRLAVEGQTTRLRQAAASAIREPAMWQDLLPRLRGRDKAAYKLIKQRLDALLCEQRTLAQAMSDAQALCTSIEKHAARPHDALYAPTLASYTLRWRALPAEFDPEIRQRGQQALDRCLAVIAAHAHELARAAAERAADEARARELDAELLAQQQAAAEQAAADAIAQTAADRAREAEVRADQQAQTQELTAKQATDAQALADIVSLIRLSGAALARGDTRKAARFRQSIDAALPEAPALPLHLSRSLEQLDHRLNELRQWKDYAAAPKRIQLIEEMEALIGVEEAPDALAEHIRALRQEWRTLNKGLEVETTAELERFEKAFTAAFQPCQVHFAEQAAMRRANLDARKQVLERVLAFEAGLPAEQPDHALIMLVLREAPQEWRSHSPVDRDVIRPLDAEFFSALDRLRARVNAWHARNTADKQALIARAQQLTTATDTARAIDEAKRLQAEWKATGPVPHSQSQSLWEEFRGLCNAVFERRQQEYAQQAATLEQSKAQAVALCEQIEQASREGPADRPSGEAKLREWQDAFNALGELPRNESRQLHDRYQRAMSRYEALIAGLARRDAEAAETDAVAAARQVRAYQRAVIRNDADLEALRAATEAFIAGVPRWPNKGILQALRQSLARAESAGFAQADDAAREQALRKLCIRAEILSGATTPPGDVAQRREQEMQLLSQGLGQARQADDRAWEAMRIEWLGLDAAEPGVHDELERRFMLCLRQRAKPPPAPFG